MWGDMDAEVAGSGWGILDRGVPGWGRPNDDAEAPWRLDDPFRTRAMPGGPWSEDSTGWGLERASGFGGGPLPLCAGMPPCAPCPSARPATASSVRGDTPAGGSGPGSMSLVLGISEPSSYPGLRLSPDLS